MAKTPPATIEHLQEFYEQLIQDQANAMMAGHRLTTGDLLKSETSAMEEAKVERIGVRYSLRRKLLLRIFSTRLRDTEQDTLEEIMDSVDDQMTKTSLEWLKSQKWARGDSSSDFTDNLIGAMTKKLSGKYLNRIENLVRPSVLLELLVRYPMKAYSLNHSSSYIPERTFSSRKINIPELNKIFAHAIVDYLPPNVARMLPEIENYIMPEEGNAHQTGAHQLRQFYIPYCTRFDWKLGWNKLQRIQAARELTHLYCLPPQKKAIYKALLDCLRIIAGQAGNVQRPIKEIRNKTDFVVGAHCYGAAMDAINEYAINQLIVKLRVNPTKVLDHTRLSRKSRLKIIGGDKPGHYTIGVFNTRIHITPDSDFRNTNKLTPFCVALLNQFYQSALKYTQSP
jgi:hypothetical protein